MCRYLLPRQLRIRRRVEFTACYERGRRYHTEHFLVFCCREAVPVFARAQAWLSPVR